MLGITEQECGTGAIRGNGRSWARVVAVGLLFGTSLGQTIALAPLAAQQRAPAQAVVTSVPTAPAVLPAFAVADQFDRTLTREALGGKVVVFLVAARSGANAAEAWSNALREPARARDIRVVNVADLKGAPRLLRALIRRDFPKDTSRAILMDFGGTIGRALRGERAALVGVVYGSDGRLLRSLELPITSPTVALRERLLAETPQS